MTSSARRKDPPTRADLDALPEHMKGEIIEGVLHTMPRPRMRHQDAAGGILEDLRPRFQRGRGGPGGWWIVIEPGIEVPTAIEFSPDLAGWRRERMPEPPPSDSAITVVPDWVCEVLSPSTRRHNVFVKRPFYARIGVQWLWYVDVEARGVTVSKLQDGLWLEVANFSEETAARIPPFDAVELDVTQWWMGLGPEER